MFDVNKLKEGDEVAFVEYDGNEPCKAIVIGFTKHHTRKVRLSVNYNYHAGNEDPDATDLWDTREVPLKTIHGAWWEHERAIMSNRKLARSRSKRREEVNAKAEVLMSELKQRGIAYNYSLNQFSLSVDDLEKLMGPCFPRSVS